MIEHETAWILQQVAAALKNGQQGYVLVSPSIDLWAFGMIVLAVFTGWQLLWSEPSTTTPCLCHGSVLDTHVLHVAARRHTDPYVFRQTYRWCNRGSPQADQSVARCLQGRACSCRSTRRSRSG